MKLSTLVLCVSPALVLSSGLLYHAAAQPAPTAQPAGTAQPNPDEGKAGREGLEVRKRFESKVPVLSAAKRSPAGEVVFRAEKWLLANNSEADVQERGFLVVRLIAGAVTAVIDGKAEKHEHDSYFTVPAGAKLTLKTERDHVAMKVVVIERHGGVPVEIPAPTAVPTAVLTAVPRLVLTAVPTAAPTAAPTATAAPRATAPR